MNKIGFEQFVDSVTSMLIDMSTKDADERFSRKTSPTGFEKLVLEASQKVIHDENLLCETIYKEGSIDFPDIVFDFSGRKFGIEVKSSTSAKLSDNTWTILGNSILGSTRIDVEDTHIVYVKVNKNGCFVKSARYEDAVSDIVVTHSPRYKINLAQEPDESFFVRSGIAYDEINRSDDPIGLVTDYFRNQGETAWWIAESTPATIRGWREVDLQERNEILATAYLLFPELLYSKSNDKYKRFSKWLAANYSVVDTSLRDRFTAGGRISITDEDNYFEELPRIYETFNKLLPEFKKQLREISKNELQEYWNNYNPTKDSYSKRLEFWWSEIKHNIVENESNQSEIEFMEYLVSKIQGPNFF